MYIQRLVLGLVFCSAVLAVAAPGGSSTPAGTSGDEQLLQKAQIDTSGPALLNYFRQRTVADTDRQRIEALIRQLGDSAYAVRERAMTELVACGLPAVGPLRQAEANPDVEIVRRAERCLERIERVPSTALSAAAARLIARQKPDGAAAVLLAYLPLADDENVGDEVREALSAVALKDGRPDPLLEQALEDPLPVKRGAAAEALIRTGRPEAVAASRKALADGNLDVRLRTALALVTYAKDRQAVPDMIRLLGDVPQGSGWRIEELLIRLAGDQAPQVSLGGDEAARQKCRDAWLAWWEQNGAKVDLAKLDGPPALLGYTLLVLRDRTGHGKVLEINANKEVVWKIEGLNQPMDAIVVGKDRVVIAESNSHLVSERDFSGNRIWSKQVPMPTGVQRLPNGHTFVTCRNQLVELDAKQHQVFSYQRSQYDIVAAQRLRNGETLFVTQSGSCIRLDARGKEVKSFQTARMNYAYGDLEVLNNKRVLLTQRNGVAEFDLEGHQPHPLWQASFSGPTSVQRLPNGNTLVASINSQEVAELDRQGHPVWQYKSPDGSLPWRARRR
jgi:hypothetical protein